MNIIFMRHGEATDNVKKLLSDKEIYWSVLTERGKEIVKKSINNLSQEIDKIYVSPFPRTIETAHYVIEKFSKAEVIIEKRLHEIDYGEYSGKKNNMELDKTRLKQIEGDYFVRLGDYGENNFDIESRLCELLNDVYMNNYKENTIMIVSHGSIISYLKRILNIKTPHIKTGEVEKFINVDFSSFFRHMKKLKNIKLKKINERIKQVRLLNISEKLKVNLINFIKKEFNNIEFSDSFFEMFLDGIGTKNLIENKSSKFDDSVILICFYNNFENFVEKWMNHYINIGIKNFVLVDSNSNDNSINILKSYEEKVNISFWKIEEEYNFYKMCGWKQQLLEFYGVGRNYLIVKSNELFIYKDYKNILFEEFLRKEKVLFIKSLILDVYTNKNIFESLIEDFNFVDKGTYRITSDVSYKQRFYGGPIFRVFGINSSLQKIPFISYTGNLIFVSDHYYYPWNINNKAKFCSYLLRYLFLPNDNKKYNICLEDNRFFYDLDDYLLNNNRIYFYDDKVSIPINDIDFSF